MKFNSTHTAMAVVRRWIHRLQSRIKKAGNVDVKGHGNSGTLECGGGFDTRPLIQLKGVPLLRNLPIGSRLEVRDCYSGQPHYGVDTRGSFQNSVVFTG